MPKTRHTRSDEHPDAIACIAEIDAVLKRYGFELSHEDGHGAFILIRTKPGDGGAGWLDGCYVDEH